MPMMLSIVVLPAPDGPHDRNELTLGDIDVHTAEHIGSTEPGFVGLFDVAQSDHGRF